MGSALVVIYIVILDLATSNRRSSRCYYQRSTHILAANSTRLAMYVQLLARLVNTRWLRPSSFVTTR